MAEALAVIGIAASILQIFDFGARVLKCTIELSSATHDALREEVQLKNLMKEQEAVDERVQLLLEATPAPSDNEQAVVRLSGECRKETARLLGLLEQLKASTDRNRIKRTARNARKALGFRRKREQIEGHRKSLQLLNSQIATSLLLVVRDQNEAKNASDEDLMRGLDTKTRCIMKAIMDARDELKGINDDGKEGEQLLRTVISSLEFPDMEERRQSIAKSFPKTFQWALEHDTCGLRTWLRTGSDIFWVSGNAGSGKSTFMKFLGNDQRTFGHLCEWAGKAENLILVQCYFWYLGSSLQKSIEGLLRSILHQIFKACPKLAELVLPIRLEQSRKRLSAAQSTWSLEELEEVLGNIKPSLLKTSQIAEDSSANFEFPRFCILIDGLDEYDGHHGRLVQILQDFASDGCMKLCVSSRPWHVFVRAFESHKPHLSLQDLTRNDIKLYVDSNLSNALSAARRFEPTSSTDEDAAAIVNDIVNRAEGVFLWVYLVVQSVLRGFDAGDTTAILRQRVLQFPSDLESFFEIMIARIDSVYHRQTSQALYLAYLYAGNADAATHSSYLDFELLSRSPCGLEDPRYLYDLDPQALTPEDFVSLAHKTRTFLSACCKDLLVVSIPSGSTCANSPSGVKVQFLHRTVFEYLEMNLKDELERSVPMCLKNGAAFHLLNMGKLKLYWACETPWISPYFCRQASFSLDRVWPGITLEFVAQLQQCQPLHQKRLCASLGAAFVAFEEFDTFFDLFAGHFNPAPLGERFASLEIIHSLNGVSATFVSLLAAALGVADCRQFPAQKINLTVLGSILTFTAGRPAKDAGAVLIRFLESTLPPLVEASTKVSTDVATWHEFTNDLAMRHAYDVMQLLLRNSSIWDDFAVLMHGCPISDEPNYKRVWCALQHPREYGLSLPETLCSPRGSSGHSAGEGEYPLTQTLPLAGELEKGSEGLCVQDFGEVDNLLDIPDED